jgi:hypothetical protein
MTIDEAKKRITPEMTKRFLDAADVEPNTKDPDAPEIVGGYFAAVDNIKRNLFA